MAFPRPAMPCQHGFLVSWFCVCLLVRGLDTAKLVQQDRPVIYPAALEDNRVHQIPESILIQMKDIRNLTQLLDFLGASGKPGIGGPRPIDGPSSEDKNGTVHDRRQKPLSGGFDISNAAGCEVETQTVELEKPTDPTHVYWPMCVRLPRCGGCCTSSLLECVPLKTTKVEAKVLHAAYLGADLEGQFDVMGFKSVKVEKHESCSCQCRERAEHCTSLQVYRAEECRCICSNEEAREACSDHKWLWDSKECSCKCRELGECSTGFFFNGITCRCEAVKASLVGRKGVVKEDSAIPTNPDLNFNNDTSNSSDLSNEQKERLTSTSSTTTTTNRPPIALSRSRIGLPLRSETGGARYKEQHVGIRPTDEDDDHSPYTLAQSQDDNQGRRITPNHTASDTTP